MVEQEPSQRQMMKIMIEVLDELVGITKTMKKNLGDLEDITRRPKKQ